MNKLEWKKIEDVDYIEHENLIYTIRRYGNYSILLMPDGEKKKFREEYQAKKWVEKKLVPHKFEMNWCNLCDKLAGPYFVIVGTVEYYEVIGAETFGLYDNYEDAVKRGEEVSNKRHVREVHMSELDLENYKNHTIQWF